MEERAGPAVLPDPSGGRPQKQETKRLLRSVCRSTHPAGGEKSRMARTPAACRGLLLLRSGAARPALTAAALLPGGQRHRGGPLGRPPAASPGSR